MRRSRLALKVAACVDRTALPSIGPSRTPALRVSYHAPRTSAAAAVRLERPTMEEALYDPPMTRRFAGLGDLNTVPDEPEIPQFRPLLDTHGVAAHISGWSTCIWLVRARAYAREHS